MRSLVFATFSFEAYLNHIGVKSVDNWKRHDRMSVKSKLQKIAERVSLEIDYSKRPWSILEELFGFRNDVAHGRSIRLIEAKTVPVSQHDAVMREFAKTEWEKSCTRENAERAKADVEAMVTMLHEKGGLTDEFPFITGSQGTLVTYLVEGKRGHVN
jgi:Holliday junction resolvasome RuvABC endonuclease subunit